MSGDLKIGCFVSVCFEPAATMTLCKMTLKKIQTVDRGVTIDWWAGLQPAEGSCCLETWASFSCRRIIKLSDLVLMERLAERGIVGKLTLSARFFFLNTNRKRRRSGPPDAAAECVKGLFQRNSWSPVSWQEGKCVYVNVTSVCQGGHTWSWSHQVCQSPAVSLCGLYVLCEKHNVLQLCVWGPTRSGSGQFC